MILNKKQAADYLKISLRLLDTLLHDGEGPQFFKIRKRLIRFRQEDLDTWIAEQPSYTSISKAS